MHTTQNLALNILADSNLNRYIFLWPSAMLIY